MAEITITAPVLVYPSDAYGQTGDLDNERQCRSFTDV